MFAPEDPLSPPNDHFEAPWQATVLAMAVAMIREGHLTQAEWAEALGAALESAKECGQPDTNETYFLAALSALEKTSEQSGISISDRETRKSEWQEAYRRTPHGQPVNL